MLAILLPFSIMVCPPIFPSPIGFLTLILFVAEAGADARSLAAVILRRNISFTATDSQDILNQANNANLWKRLSVEAQTVVKNELIKAIAISQEKTVVHKICNLMIEIQGTMYDENEAIWQELMNLLF